MEYKSIKATKASPGSQKWQSFIVLTEQLDFECKWNISQLKLRRLVQEAKSGRVS